MFKFILIFIGRWNGSINTSIIVSFTSNSKFYSIPCYFCCTTHYKYSASPTTSCAATVYNSAGKLKIEKIEHIHLRNFL